jgi:DNA-binding transcriptional MerR regulator
MVDEPRYGIGDLAGLGGVSRRTVRYYVQENLLPPPFGLGRGDHYGPAHLDRLLQVKALQEAGRTLEEIRRAFGGSSARRSEIAELKASPRRESPPRELWRRVILADGVELHVAGNVRLPAPGRLAELAAWCRENFATPGNDIEE